MRQTSAIMQHRKTEKEHMQDQSLETADTVEIKLAHRVEIKLMGTRPCCNTQKSTQHALGNRR